MGSVTFSYRLQELQTQATLPSTRLCSLIRPPHLHCLIFDPEYVGGSHEAGCGRKSTTKKLPTGPNRFHQHGWGLIRQDGSQVRLTARLDSPNPHAS